MKHLMILAFSISLLILRCPLTFGQINGSSTNLCPEKTYTYTSAAGCDQFNWTCTGCLNPNDNTISIIDHGTNSDGTVWATVQWANTPSGKIGNYCGTLDVSIISISQPSIQGPSTVLLCGTGSITLNASVSSTTNITGYIWDISGSGVTSQTVSTTTPQITINYSNWTSASTYSATVAVAAKESCGYNTHTTPLAPWSPLPGVTFPAIPRSAWVQLSPGNIDNLKVQYNFSPPIICSSDKMVITNQPANTSVNWVSNSPSALAVTDAANGYVNRLNSYQGNANVSATVSNACGSWTESYNVWLGAPGANINTLIYPSGKRGVNPVTLSSSSTYSFICDPVGGAISYNWVLPAGFSFLSGNGSSPVYINTPSSSGSYNLSCSVLNICGSNYTHNLGITITSGGGGGGGAAAVTLNTYPNPTSGAIKLDVSDSLSNKESSKLDNPYQVIIMDKSSNKVISIDSSDKSLHIPTDGLQAGIYFLKFFYKDAVLERRIVIKK